jgi:hypothetical protein
MQVRLYLPFVDSRYLDPELSPYIVEPQKLLSPGKLFIRCGGKKNKNKNRFNCQNTITVSSNTIPKIKMAENTLEYPFGNKLIGVYLFAFDFKENKQFKIPADKIPVYINKNLDVNLRILFEKPKVQHEENPAAPRNSKVKTSLLKLKDEMRLQYYLSTLRLREEGPYKKDKKQIKDPNSDKSIESILFLTPIVSIDKEPRHNPLIKDTNYAYTGKNVRVCKILGDEFFLYHIRREWRYSIISKKKRKETEYINDGIDSIVKCDYSLNAIDTLLSVIKSKYNSAMTKSAIEIALDYCMQSGNSFPIFNIGLDNRTSIKNLQCTIENIKDKNHFDIATSNDLEKKLQNLDSLIITGLLIK